MRVVLGSMAALLLLAGCGDQRAPTATDDPSMSPPATTSASPTPPPATETPTPTPAPTPHVAETIPDDFPLLDGLPESDEAERGPHYGRHGPNRELEPLVPQACGERVNPPAGADLLRGEWASIEDFRERQLLDFASTEEAQAYAERVLDLFRACPRDEDEIEARLTTVEETGLGDAAGVARRVYRQQGYPVPGQTTTHVVRVGTAVLLSITYNEGGTGSDPEQEAAEETAATSAAIEGVVEAMAVFQEVTYPSEPPFGPEGFGQVTLRMSRDELLALPGVRITGNNGQCDWFEAPGVDGGLQPGLGVAVLFVSADLETPERIHVGSTLDEARTAYPHGSYGNPWFSVPIPEYGDRSYRFEVGRDGRVITVMLLHDDQHCGG